MRIKNLLNHSSLQKFSWFYVFVAIVLALIVLPFCSNQKGSGSMRQDHNNQYQKVQLDHVNTIFDQVMKETDKHWQPRSYVYMRLVCMRSAGWQESDYGTLMTLSGFGPAFAYHHGENFAAHYSTPKDADQRIEQATGFGWEWLRCKNLEEYWQTLKETIDSGRPVHAPFLEEILFIGYKEALEKKKRKVRPVAAVFVKPNSWWSWKKFRKWFYEHSSGFIGRHTGRQETISTKEASIDVLKTIVQLAYNDPRSNDRGNGGVKWGLEGIKAYATDIADITKKESYFQSGWLGCHNIYPQWTGRALTAKYLEESAQYFSSDVSRSILAAANAYQAAHEAWLEWEKHLGNCEVAPKNSWKNKEHREAGANAVFKAYEHEKKAVAYVQQAIAALDIQPPIAALR